MRTDRERMATWRSKAASRGLRGIGTQVPEAEADDVLALCKVMREVYRNEPQDRLAIARIAQRKVSEGELPVLAGRWLALFIERNEPWEL